MNTTTTYNEVFKRNLKKSTFKVKPLGTFTTGNVKDIVAKGKFTDYKIYKDL